MPPDWTDIELSLKNLSRPALARFVGRAAARVVPLVAKAEPAFGPEAIEWLNVLDSAVRVVLAFADGKPASPFTLGIAADLARGVANARVNLSRTKGGGSGQLVEELEAVCAAVAFAADAVRATSVERAVRAGMQAASSADAACADVRPLLAFDAKLLAAGMADELGDLWPTGEPEWFRQGIDRLHAATGLPRVLVLD
jgi:hypothetical protein